MLKPLFVLRTVALAAYFGGGCAIALIVAPVAFKTLAPDKVSAGAVVGGALHVFEYAAFGALGLALAASLALRWLKQPSLLCDVGIGALLAGTLFLSAWVSPSLSAARPQGTGPGTEFDGLHKTYERVFGIELLVALAALSLSASARKKD